MIISTLTAMTVLTMLYRASLEELKGYNIGPKFWLVKLGLIIDNLQSALLNVLSSLRLLGCRIPFPMPVRSNREYLPFSNACVTSFSIRVTLRDRLGKARLLSGFDLKDAINLCTECIAILMKQCIKQCI